MNRIIIYILVILMLFSDATSAQIKTAIQTKWKVIGELPAESRYEKSLGFAGPVAGIHNNVLLIAGGANFPDSLPWQGGKKKYYNDVYLYVRKGSRIILKKNSFKLSSNIAYAANCSTPQGIVYAGGENENGISDKVFLLQCNKNTSKPVIKNLPDLPEALTNAALTIHDNIIYLAGGETANTVSDKFYALNMHDMNSGWITLPAIPKPVSHTVLLTQLKNNHPRIYLISGRKKNIDGISDLYSSVFEFDIMKNKWEEKRPLPYTLSAGTGIATGEYGILMFGGDKGETFHKVETTIAAINVEKKEEKKQALMLEKNKLLSAHPGFTRDMLWYSIEDNEWSIAGTIPFDTPVTTTAVKWGNDVIIPSGEIKAGVRSPKILSVKILPKPE